MLRIKSQLRLQLTAEEFPTGLQNFLLQVQIIFEKDMQVEGKKNWPRPVGQWGRAAKRIAFLKESEVKYLYEAPNVGHYGLIRLFLKP